MSFAKFAFLLVLVCSIPVFYAYGQLDDKPPQGVLRSGIVGVKLLDAYFGTSTEKMQNQNSNKENSSEKIFMQLVFFSKIEAKCDLPENFSPYRLIVFLIHFGQQLIKLYAS